MKRKIAAGTTDLNLTVIVYDNTSTSGAGLSGLTHTTSGLILEWRRDGDSSWTQLGVGTGLAAGILGSYVSGGIVASGSRAGRYQIGIPNAALTSGARFVEVCLRGAANMHPVDIEIELDAVNYQDATRFGLSAIPNVAQGSSGALATGNASGQVTLAGVTHTGAVIPTVSTVTNAVTAGTVTDKTGYSLASNGLASVTSWTVNITGNLSGSVGSVTGNVGGNVTGSVGSISGVTFPASFGSWTAPLTTSGTASAVWDALIASYTVANSFGARVLRTDHASAGNAAKVTGAGHVAADVHELQPAVIDNTHFAAGAIDANAIAADAIGASELAADAVTEIIAGMATQPQLVDLATMIINDGTANARFSASALQNAPSGGGGGGSTTVNVMPYTGAVPDRVEGTTIKVFYNELTNVSVGVTDATGAAVTLGAKTLRFCVEDRYGADVLTLNDGDITRSGSTFTVQIPQSLTDTVGANYRWSLRDLTSSLNTVLIHGQMIVAEAAEDEA